MAKEWFIQDVLEIVQGPFTSSVIRELAKDGTITSHTLIGQSRNGPWVEGSRVKGLSELISMPAPPSSPKVAEPHQVEQATAMEPSLPSKARRRTVGKSGLSPLGFGLAVLIASLLGFTLLSIVSVLSDRRPEPESFNPLRYDLTNIQEVCSAFYDLQGSEFRLDPELMVFNFLDVTFNRVWAAQATRERSQVLRHRGIQDYFAASWDPDLRRRMVWDIEDKQVRDRSMQYLPLRDARFKIIEKELRGGKSLDDIVEGICPLSNIDGKKPNSWDAELLATTIPGLQMRNNIERSQDLDPDQKTQAVQEMVERYVRQSIYKAAGQ